jgi:hypothetical protein
MVRNRPATSVELAWDASDISPKNTYARVRRHPILWGILCDVSESEFSSRMWTVENGEVEESGVESTLEKQVGVELRPKRMKSGGPRLVVLMTR